MAYGWNVVAVALTVRTRETCRMRPVMLFDGDCAFCTSTARWLQRVIPTDVEMLPWQFADLDGLGISAERAQREVVWVGVDGATAGGAQALARYLAGAGGGWPALGLMFRMPPIRWLAAGAYRLIANNRHRLPGGTPACALRPGGSSDTHQPD